MRSSLHVFRIYMTSHDAL